METLVAPDVSTTGFDPELLMLRRKQVELRAARLAAMKRDGLPFYHPHAKQDRFHRSTAKRRGVFTGNRFGKSHMGCAEDCAWLRGERPWYGKDDPGRTLGISTAPVKGLVIVNDWDKAKEIWSGDDGKLWRFLPKGSYRTSRNHSGAIDTVFYTPNGSALRFDTVKSFLSNPQGAESSDYDFIHVDEPCPEAMFKAQARGLVDRHGSAWFTLTALREPWITDAFEPDGVFARDMFVVDGTIYDNPFLAPQAIADYEATLTEEEKECRLYGKPLHKAGLVYKQFSRDRHVLSEVPKGWDSFIRPPKDWPVYYYIDPHASVPHTVLLLTVDQRGRIYVFLDVFERCLIKELCAKLRDITRDYRLIRGRIDPIAYIEDQVSGGTWADDFARGGFSVEKAVKDPMHGIDKVQELLKADPQMVFFCPTARRTLWEIQRFHWDPETNKPVDKDDHAMECLYRAVLDTPCWVDATVSKPVEDEDFPTLRFDVGELAFDRKMAFSL
jgi:hypothetical protein